jgi:hypothetical protein
MNTEASRHHEAVIALAMTIAERNGYPTSAWRLFETEAEATFTKEAALTKMSKH